MAEVCLPSETCTFLFSIGTHKVLPDVSEVLAILVERLLKQVGLGGGPLLHFVPAQHGARCRHQGRQRRLYAVAGLVESVHRVELPNR